MADSYSLKQIQFSCINDFNEYFSQSINATTPEEIAATFSNSIFVTSARTHH
ncbi:MAG: hypothetical protein OFPI_15580 [Osedax symbiont Rs2]|nr:MAG: hypothetical protein OFPI_15580 [Osedax symbiont Rs2]